MIFEERQRFRQWWAWIAIAAPAVIAWTLFFLQIVGGEPVGDDPAPDWVIWLMVVAMGIGFPLWFALLTLETIVDSDGVHVRFRNGIGRKDISFADIRGVQSRAYRPLLEFGGWGLRWGRHQRRAFTASGTQGVDIDLADGRTVLIGSQRADELAGIIKDRL